ncbi:ATP-binding protein [Halarchaeum salinum]|uniref:histidine kinase n=1 Tax=Halarchaeum salinum TaxID=489912 RepID=A0AAV3S6X7_9EURY
MQSRNGTRIAGAITAALGITFFSITVYNAFENVLVRGDPVSASAFETLLPGLAELVLVALGVWIYRCDDGTDIAHYVLVSMAAGATSILAIALWETFFQQYQRGFQPLYILTSMLAAALVISALLGIYFSKYTHERRISARLHDRFSVLFRNVPDPVFGVVSRDGVRRVELVNPAFEAALDVDEEAVSGRPLAELAVEADDDADSLPRETPTESDWVAESITIRTRGGQREFVRLDSPLADDRSVDRDIGVYIDVTDDRQRAERLDVLRRVIRHNLRNKLTIISGNATSLRKRDVDGTAAELLDHLAVAADELVSLSERAYEIEAAVATDDVETRPHPVSSLVEDAVDSVRVRYPHADYEVACLPDLFASGTSALGMAVEALIENAVAHNDADDPTVRVTGEIDADGFVDIAVEDDGPGIDPETRELIAGERTHGQIDHLDGLGLWLAQWAATDADGRLSFADTEAGTTVHLHVPQASAPTEA